MITTTPDLDTGAIRLTWETPAPVTAIIRTDANGNNSVRTLTGTLPTESGTVEDYEAALSGPVSYQLVTDAGSLPAPAAALDLTVEGLVAIPQEPARRVILPILRETTEKRDAASTDDVIIGRPDVLPTVWGHSLRHVSYRAVFASHADAAALTALLARGRVVLLRQPAHGGLDAYHLARSSTITPGDDYGRTWLVDWAGIEQRAPIGPILGTLDWDYDDVAATYPDYATLETAFEDYTALEAGEAI